MELRALTHVHRPDKGHVLIRNLFSASKKLRQLTTTNKTIHATCFHKIAEQPDPVHFLLTVLLY